MATFRFTAVDDKGQRRDGVLDVPDAASAVAQLHARQWTPLDVRPAGAGARGTPWAPWRKSNKVDGDALLRFTDQLATLLAAGQPIDRALAILQESASGAMAQAASASAAAAEPAAMTRPAPCLSASRPAVGANRLPTSSAPDSAAKATYSGTANSAAMAGARMGKE